MAVQTGVLPERYAEPRLIGHGGMGEIYLAEDRELGRKVAVKVLAERFARNEALRARFTREAHAAARLSGQPHVVTIYDVGEWDERPYIVMEYLPGGTLSERARGGPVDHAQALDWVEQAASALDAAHALGIVHRDVKPANLLFDERDSLRVVDFGVARVVDETTGQLTAAGTVLGTAGYISPEQARGEPVSAASDLYALGVVAYELLTGGRPFARGSATAEALAHVHESVPPASARGVGLPGAVDAVFGRALAKDPHRRYESAAHFIRALRAALEPGEDATRAFPAASVAAAREPPVPARSHRRSSALVPLAGAAAAALAVGGLIAAFAATGNGDEGTERPPPPAAPPAAAPEPVTVTVERKTPGKTVVQTVTQAVPPAPPAPAPAPAAGGLSTAQAAALNDEAYSLMLQGRYAEALPLLQNAVPALRGTYSPAYRYEAYAEYNLGKTLAELGRCESALPHLERSEALQGEREPITAAKQQCGA